jgi:hypothetical protein
VSNDPPQIVSYGTIGYTPIALAIALPVGAWQSSVAAIVGAVVGLPLGIVLGRTLWDGFARSLNAVPDPVVPTIALLAIGLGALCFGNLVAALPGRSAARTSTSLLLRAE